MTYCKCDPVKAFCAQCLTAFIANHPDRTDHKKMVDLVKDAKSGIPIVHPGTILWKQLHNQALSLSSWSPQVIEDWYTQWELRIPNINCECRRHWKELVERNPPDFGSPLAFFVWGVARHNDVNRRLGKPEISIDEACQLYGWP